VRDFLTGKVGELSAARPPDAWPHPQWGDFSRIAGGISQLAWLLDDGVRLLKSLDLLAKAKSLYNLGPIEARLRTQLNTTKVAAWAAAGGRLRLGMVGLETGLLRWVTETGSVIEANGDAVTGLGPSCPEEEQAVAEIEAAIRQLQADLHAATAKPPIVRQIRELQAQLPTARKRLMACLAQARVEPAQTDLQSGVLASASIPGLFRAVTIAGETYVDGGVREILPVREAVRLGAKKIFAVSAGTSQLSRAPHSFGEAPMFDIVSRALTEIMVNEVGAGDSLPPHRIFQIATPGRPGGTVPGPLWGGPLPPTGTTGQTEVLPITPTVDAYSITTIDPGLIQINRDYGYMRADDVVRNMGPQTREWLLSDQIARVRIDIWHLENLVAGSPDPRRPDLQPPAPNPNAQAGIDQMKQGLNDLLTERRNLGGGMPADIFDWIGRPERHP
jgi:hypothetical protein